MTHYLAQKRRPDFPAFWRFLKSMSQMPPLQPRTPEEPKSKPPSWLVVLGYIGAFVLPAAGVVIGILVATWPRGRVTWVPDTTIEDERPW